MLSYIAKFGTLLMILISSSQTNHLRTKKNINHDLALTNKWLRASKTSLNKAKTEIIIFREKNWRIKKHLNFRISEQKVEPCAKVKYLGMILQQDLEWNAHTNNLNTKLNRSINLLAKIRHYISKFPTENSILCNL